MHAYLKPFCGNQNVNPHVKKKNLSTLKKINFQAQDCLEIDTKFSFQEDLRNKSREKTMRKHDIIYLLILFNHLYKIHVIVKFGPTLYQLSSVNTIQII